MKRRLAREIAIQSLYQMEMNEVEAEEAVTMLISEAAGENESEVDLSDVDATKEFVLEIVNGTWDRKVEIDELLVDYLKGWHISRLSKVDRQVLRLAAYEMIYRDDIQAKLLSMKRLILRSTLGRKIPGNL